MKLSEAILLGDSLKRPDAGCWLVHRLFGRPRGCAIAGAVLATHLGKASEISGLSILWLAKTRWPWLTDDYVCRISGYYQLVVAKKMTIEQLVDWVRSVEPAEEGGNNAEVAVGTVRADVADLVTTHQG